MELSTVLVVIVVAVAALLLMKVVGKVFSLVFSVLGVVAVVWLVVAGLRWMDEENVRDNLLDSNNLFLLSDGGQMITGFATQDNITPDTEGISVELSNPNSEVYDDFYKVIVINKESLPQKTALMVDVLDDADRQALFKSYVENNILEEDAADRIIEEEEAGNLEVYKETLAFRHGIKEILRP